MRPGLVLFAAVAAILGSQAAPAPGAEEYVPECGPPEPMEVRPVDLTVPARGVARLTWPSQMGYNADIVRGSLKSLRATMGDFVQSTEKCILDDSGGTSFDDPDIPPPKDGYWYLVRPDQYAGCGYGIIGYNSTEGCQVGFTNAEIQASGRDCTCSLICARDP